MDVEKEDKDMIVMYHKFGYELDGRKKQIDSTMVSIGEDQTFTAMSRTVGLPLGIAVLKMIKKEITRPGVLRPIYPEIYKPILDELEEYGIEFTETQTKYLGYNPHNLK